MAGDRWHRDRRRASSFGAAAVEYDRYRPPYSDALFDDLAALRPDSVLDVGCGTGRAAVGLVARGLDVLGVEPDDRMAAVARGRGVEVEVGSFEDWDDAGRTFDLVVSGTAWHWVEPVRGTAKAAAVLRPGGTFARFWHFHDLEPSALERLERVYAECAPGVSSHGRPADPPPEDPVAEHPAFGEVTTSVWRTDTTFTSTGWLDLAGTFSDHMTMEPDRRAVLFAALRSAIDDDLDGTLRATSCTYEVRCQRARVRELTATSAHEPDSRRARTTR